MNIHRKLIQISVISCQDVYHASFEAAGLSRRPSSPCQRRANRRLLRYQTINLPS